MSGDAGREHTPIQHFERGQQIFECRDCGERHLSRDAFSRECKPLPEIVCLCGSTRFEDAYKREQFRLTVEGKIVLTVAGNWKDDHRDVWDEIDDEDKAALDELHFRKIELADRIHVLNVDGYIGDSTRNEINHAIETGTDISWLEPDEIPEPYTTGSDRS